MTPASKNSNPTAMRAPNMKTAPLVLWGRTSPADPWLKLTNNTSKAEMARRTKAGWEVLRVPVGKSPIK